MISINENGLTIKKDDNNYIIIGNKDVSINNNGDFIRYKETYGQLFFTKDNETWTHILIGKFDDLKMSIKKYSEKFSV